MAVALGTLLLTSLVVRGTWPGAASGALVAGGRGHQEPKHKIKPPRGKIGRKGRVTSGTGSTTSTSTTPPALLTSCSSVVVIGDSTSDSLISNDYINPSEQIPAQLQRVGVQSVNLQISGARSLNETYEGQPNGIQVAQQLIQQGYRGCWIVALGTNDVADVAVGSSMSMVQRIQSFMSIVGNQPVMWVNLITLLSSGDYAESSMQQWDADLLQACPSHPNMRVFNWAGVAQPAWFISDGIHYNSPGSAIRSAAYANALATAFPSPPPKSKGQQSCLVNINPAQLPAGDE